MQTRVGPEYAELRFCKGKRSISSAHRLGKLGESWHLRRLVCIRVTKGHPRRTTSNSSCTTPIWPCKVWRWGNNTCRRINSQISSGFFNAIALSTKASLQDTLQLLTLWFNYGHHESIWTTINSGLEKVNIETWLPVRDPDAGMSPDLRLRFQVIPQFIARIYHSQPRVRDTIHELLINIGRLHPQVYNKLLLQSII